MQEGLSEPEFHGNLVHQFRNVGKADVLIQFQKTLSRYTEIRYNTDILRQTACLVVNLIMTDNFASGFNCTTVGRPQTR